MGVIYFRKRDPCMPFNTLEQKIKEYNLPVDIELIQLAYEFAFEAHAGQIRLDGELYIEHSVQTAITLVELRMDQATLIAGLLHDVSEDTSKTLQDIRENFGEEVAMLVDGVTKLGKLKYRGIDRYIENLRKMFIAMASDIRTVIIKFADRLHNLKTLYALPKRKQERIAKETLEIYAPIAHRLGIGVLRSALEDEAFKYALPNEYQRVKELVEDKSEYRLACLEEVKHDIGSKLKENAIQVIDCHGRAKGLYSLYKKIVARKYDISQVYDLVALRVILPSITDCYAALGIIHSMYKPLKGRIKDYIAQPKPNHYRSLHTTVFCTRGEIIEIQIRNQKMHEEAEYGIAAHWHYKDALDKQDLREHIEWIQELAQWHKSKEDTEDYLRSLKLDVFQNRVFIFTPKGDVIDLPEDSTPIDFAFHIHTDIGNQTVGAWVNDEIVPLDTRLKSGDIVEIITDKHRKGPNYDWLKFVKTRTARSKIRTGAKVKLWQRIKPWK